MQPRVFSMQKIVEVADFNMDARPRVVWAQVWDVLAKFFAKVGCHPNHGVAMFAIDSLKQLSLKFLEKVGCRVCARAEYPRPLRSSCACVGRMALCGQRGGV